LDQPSRAIQKGRLFQVFQDTATQYADLNSKLKKISYGAKCIDFQELTIQGENGRVNTFAKTTLMLKIIS
jgi:hypothetical protein